MHFKKYFKRKDPIQKVEDIVKEVNHTAGHYVRPIFHRYPLLFTFLIVFSVSAILDGFRILVDESEFFRHHPVHLIAAGITALILTGTLYRALENMK